MEGVLFKGTSGEALFYDGFTFVDLFSSYPTPLAKNSWERWGLISTQDPERTFLRQIIQSPKTPLLAEIKAGPQLIPISLSEKLSDQFLSIFTLPHDPRLWVIGKNSILAEVDGNLQTVISVPEPYFIERASGTEETSEGSIWFILQNKNTDSSTDYFLRHVSNKAQCKVTLNSDKFISLNDDLIGE